VPEPDSKSPTDLHINPGYAGRIEAICQYMPRSQK
jgi:hypothetical protein